MHLSATSIPENRFKRRLAANEKLVGLWLTLASPAATEIAAGAGFDWVLVDMEHSSNELPDVVDHLRAAHGGTAEVIVRLPWNEPVMVKRLLDAGVRSLMFPFVQSAEEARAAVAATRYPPRGIRGYAGTSRATNYGRFKDYARRSHEETCVIVQVETPAAIAAVSDIAGVEGVDGVFIGPNDLATNMGHLGDPTVAEVKTTIEDACQRIRAAGKAAGLLNFREEEAKAQFAAGVSFIAVNSDAGVLARTTERIVQTFRG